MTHPFKGPPPITTPSNPLPSQENVHKTLSELESPRKHYKWYYASRPAASELLNPKEELGLFLRRYFYLKSASWPGNDTHALSGWTASELKKLPLYYIMPFNKTMREAVEECISSDDPEASKEWLPEHELAVYVDEFKRTGFQGGLNWYRVGTNGAKLKELELWADKKIEVPVVFISGRKDWGAFQEPGALERMEKLCTKWKGKHFVEGAGHVSFPRAGKGR